MSSKKNDTRDLVYRSRISLHIWAVGIFIAFSALAFSVISFFSVIQTEQNRSEFILEKQISIDGAAVSIQETLSSIADDLLMLSEYLLSSPLAESLEDSRVSTEQMFIKIAEISQKFDQIRFLDAEGMEQVRINYNYGSPEAVPLEELQNKNDRYYFSDSINLKKSKSMYPLLISILNMEK